MKSDDQETPPQKDAKPVKRRKADVTRSAILVTTARMFAEKGYSECNLREIAEKVGIKAGSFYYHFRSKEQILDEILDVSLTLMTGAVTSAIARTGPDAPALQKIAVGMRAHVATYLAGDANSAALMRVYEHLPPSMKRRSREQRRAYAQIWFDLFEQGVKEGDIRKDLDSKLMVTFMLAGMNRVMEWYNPRHMHVSDVCELAVELFLKGGVIAKGVKAEMPLA